jgi:hypothetical protein
MSVLIKGMEMPKGCIGCLFKDIGTHTMTQCMLVAGWVKYADDGNGIPDACPLVEVPTPHGRLVEFIDVAVTDDEDTGTEEINFGKALSAYLKMRSAPTVIEAEGKDED